MRVSISELPIDDKLEIRLSGHAHNELRTALSRYKRGFWGVAALSAVLNVLLLSGSIYMLMVYDSVLPSQSLPTLFGLFAMVVVAYGFQGLFDLMRGRILADIGASLDMTVSLRIQTAISDAVLRGMHMPGDGLTAMRDLDQIRNFLSSSGPAALIDLPWIFFFIAVLSMLHPWLGITALIGAIILILITFTADRATRAPTVRASRILAYRNDIAESNLRHAELLDALGMRGRMDDRWRGVNQTYIAAQEQLAQIVNMLGGASRVFRMFLQSLILTVGALLVIGEQASAGIIIASAILSGRALAPVEQAIANWRGFAAARLGWQRLTELLAQVPPKKDATVILDPPASELSVEQVFVAPPGSRNMIVSDVSFRLEAGDALGIIGQSAAGKTTLARALVGIWPPVRGAIRLDKAALDQWDRNRLGRFIGYLPQTVELLRGTIAENIARFEPDAPSTAIVNAAKEAGVHQMIVELPDGYDTDIGVDGALLSAGQRQRIALARALYRDPFLVLLDEPNSNLDMQGEEALDAAISSIRRRKGIAIIIAHRPSVVAQVNYLLYMRNGRAEAFGPRDDILRKVMAKPVAAAGPRRNSVGSQG